LFGRNKASELVYQPDDYIPLGCVGSVPQRLSEKNDTVYRRVVWSVVLTCAVTVLLGVDDRLDQGFKFWCR
jgi:hypothetical protein